MLNQTEFESFAQTFVHDCALNRVTLEKAQQTITLFDAPLFGYAAADDELFDTFLRPEVIGPHFLAPRKWLPEAQTVISFFVPFSEAVRQSNRDQQAVPSEGWLYGRIEGQQFVNAFCVALAQKLADAGYRAVVPSSSEQFWSVSDPDENGRSFTSNWSERHVAYVCGLGTFGLSKGLITERGMAGRFGSLVTDWQAQPTPRAYTQVYEYCTHCGKCAQRCPGHAISLESGKNHQMCRDYQKGILPQMLPRFGCGLCQTDVPCEACKP